ncbi:MAG: FAD-dependent oxidoreductase [Lachnospiraceae bacterium]|nr:FAD-dependent oxidoreductase [Lachnospiraceae bacterium]
MYDIIVIGGGPAGLTAAVYGCRMGKSVLLIEKEVFGGQIVNSPKVENIPGFSSISGEEFADRYLEQAMGQGCEVALEKVSEVTKSAEGFLVKTSDGSEYEAECVILATGTTHRTLGLEGEEELIGNGIHFCAVCDGDLYTGKDVVVIGGGNSAFVEANILARTAGKLVMLQDLPEFTAEARSQEELFSNYEVETHLSARVTRYETQDGRVVGVRYLENGEEHFIPCDGIFLSVGHIPENDPFASLAKLDGHGYFEADETGVTQTPGVFVAGDCRTKALRQVATACSDGANAAIAACRYLSGGAS